MPFKLDMQEPVDEGSIVDGYVIGELKLALEGAASDAAVYTL